MKPSGENRPGTPFATSWSWRSSDGTVYRLRVRANEGAGLLYEVAVSRPVRFDLHCTALHCTAWHGMAWHGIAWHGIAVHRSGGSRVRLQPRPQSGGQRPQAALLLLSTVEPSCRVRDGSQEQCNVVVDLAMLIILAREHRALAAIAQSPRAPPMLPAQSSNICLCAVSRCPHRRATQTATPSGVPPG